MRFQVIIAGRGGEGIIFTTVVLTEGAFKAGHPVVSSETHGMAQRGGSVVSQVKIGPFLSPMVPPGEADLIIATSLEEAERVRVWLRKGGLMVVNSSEGLPGHVDARKIALELGHPRGANLVLLGYALARTGLFHPSPFREAIAEKSPPRWTQKNLAAFERGFRLSP